MFILDSTAQLIKKQGAAQHLKNEDILRDLKLIHSQASDALARLGKFGRSIIELIIGLCVCVCVDHLFVFLNQFI